MGLYELRAVYAPASGRDVLAWMEDAVCRACEWDQLSQERQQTLCMGCPVRDKCRDYADDFESDLHYLTLSEVYAGETPAQRVQRRRGGEIVTMKCRKHGVTSDVYLSPRGYRLCQQCKADRQREGRARRRAREAVDGE